MIDPPQAVPDRSPDAMLGEGIKGTSTGRVVAARGLDQAQIAGPHEVIEVHAWREPFLEMTGDGNNQAKIPFSQVLRGRPDFGHFDAQTFLFTFRHTFLLFWFENSEWWNEGAGTGVS
jgi:hypothetical protein